MFVEKDIPVPPAQGPSVHRFDLEDSVITFNPETLVWAGVWLDGRVMDTETATAIADVEKLRWPDGSVR